MSNKKILISFILVILMAVSMGSIYAVDTSDDVVAADDSDEVLSASIQPTTNTSDAVQTAINNASEGDTIDLTAFNSYDFADKTVTVQDKNNLVIKGSGNTLITGYGNGNGILHIKSTNITLTGIVFKDTNPNSTGEYGSDSVKGWGVYFQGVQNGGLVENCTFYDFSQALRIQGSTYIKIIGNSFMGGTATSIKNDPTVNEETGTKTLSIMGSSYLTIENNTFNGPVLDAVSIAGGSGFGHNDLINNIFINSAYAIYYGGASTKGSVIRNNTFINCGHFVKNETVDLQGLPVISTQKSSDGISMLDNTFYAVDNSVLIAGEAGNTAHGYPSTIGNVTVSGNEVIANNSDVDMSTVTLYHILVRDGSSFQVTDDLNVTNNKFPTGVKGISIWFNDTEIYTADESVINDTLYPSVLFDTTITIDDLTITAGELGYIKLALKDSESHALRDKQVIIYYGDNYITAYTDVNGQVTIPVIEDVAGVKYATAIYLGEGSIYKASSASAKVTINAKPTPTPVVVKKVTKLTAKKATLKVNKAKKVQVTLKSGSNVVAGKKVTVKVNKKTFKATTNKKGVATISVKVTKKGKFTAVFNFAGDSNYKASSAKVVFTVKK